MQWTGSVLKTGLSASLCVDTVSLLSGCLMVALHDLKYTRGMREEAVLDEWLDKPYWQYSTGEIYFEPGYPSDSSRYRTDAESAWCGAEKNARRKPENGTL